MKEQQSHVDRVAYRPRDVGKLFGLSVRTIERWIEAGELPSVRIGGTRLVPKSAIDALLASAKSTT